MLETTAVSLQGVSKRFGNVVANQDVHLEVLEGEIHGLIGENGAGKSTIMKILYGFYHADSGVIRIRGKEVSITNPHDAIALGIGMVHQHFMLVPTLTVLENIILGQEPTHQGKIDFDTAKKDIQSIIKEYGIELDLNMLTSKLSVGLQQQVEIIKVLYRKANILILDEPTAVLTPQETQKLFQVLINLRHQGKTIILITHKMKEIFAITDRVTVFRKGRSIQTQTTKNTKEQQLVSLMVGRELKTGYTKKEFPEKQPVIELKEVTLRSSSGHKNLLHKVSLTIHKHEIVGLAGIMGNGQTELEEILSGLRPSHEGEIHLGGQRIDHLNNRGIRKLGVGIYVNEKTMGHVPEDRHHMGLILPFSVTDNFFLGHQYDKRFNKGPFIRKEKLEAYAHTMIEKYGIHPADPTLPIRALSGGNQQKVILGRELDTNPKFALISQPTRGVDIGAIESIHERIIELREQGSAILLISADLDEVMKLSDRVLVLFEGKIVAEVNPRTIDTDHLGMYMTGEVL
jgi:ABC-type uncharacterized transport system ATPase subunit